MRDAGGPLRAEDLAAFGGATWVEPLHARFRDVDVYELPPPVQGVVALEALGIYARLAPRDAGEEEHALLEAVKVAFADAIGSCRRPAARRRARGRAARRRVPGPARRRHRPGARRRGGAGRPGDTVYVAVADARGGACSLIQSLYDGFGSGLEGEGTGVLLHNRGANFVLDPAHPNHPAPGKRPYHTIMPAMLGRAGRFAGALGVVGGFMQPQGQVQVLRGLLDRGLGPQAALDAPRFRFRGGLRVEVEEGFDADALRARGHDVGRLEPGSAGGGQLVLVHADGGFAGASDRRKDGRAVAAGPVTGRTAAR